MMNSADKDAAALLDRLAAALDRIDAARVRLAGGAAALGRLQDAVADSVGALDALLADEAR